MLRGYPQNELPTSINHALSDTRNYKYVEQIFKVPLWYIEALSADSSKEPGRLWNRYIASSPSAALEVIRNHGSAEAIIHVVLPGYMAEQNNPILTRCRTLWRCCVIDDREHIVISFITDHGEFVDFQDAVELNDLERIELAWEES